MSRAYKINKEKGWFLTAAYLLLTALTVMLVVQKQLSQDYVTSNSPWEPNVERSLFLQSVGVQDADGRENYIFAGLRFAQALKQMETPEMVSFYTWVRYIEEFVNGRVFAIPFVATDAEYWEVMQFSFVEGAPYTVDDVERSRPLVILSEWAREHYFPGETSVVGRQLSIDGHDFEVCGVVKDVPYNNLGAYGEFWLPYTAWDGKIHGSSSSNDPNSLVGLYIVQIVARHKSDMPKVYEEGCTLAESFGDSEDGSKLIWYQLGTRGKNYLSRNASSDDFDMGRKDKVKGWLDSLWLLLVPLLALICLTYTISNEQSRAYAIRRVHGASKSEVALQIVRQGAKVLLLGIIIGVALGYLLVYVLPEVFLYYGDVREFRGAPWLPFTWTMLAKLLFAFVLLLFASTLLPIIKLYRTSVIFALKGGIQ